MRFRAILYFFIILNCPLMATAQTYSEIAQEYVLSHYIEAGELDWRYISNPTSEFLNSARVIYDSYIEGMREVNADLIRSKIEEESTSDFHDIMVFLNSETDLYRVVWIYVWENARCEAYNFRTETFTLTQAGEVYDSRTGPGIGRTGAVCTRH